MMRFSTVFRERIVKFGFDMRDAAGEIRDARQEARSEASKRQRGWIDDNNKWHKPAEHDPEVEAAATRRLAEEEAAIARKYDPCLSG